MATHISREEWLRAIEATSGELLQSAGWREPPVDAFKLAQRLGIAVARDDRQSGRARYARLAEPFRDETPPRVQDGRPQDTSGSPTPRDQHSSAAGRASIFLRSDPRHERLQWAVAHELGEHLSPILFDRLNLSPAEAPLGTREQLANQLANHLLLPTAWFSECGAATDWDLRQLKQRFTTASHELIARRMLELGPIAVMTIVDQGRISWRRAADGSNASRWFPGEQACWQIAHAEVQAIDRVTRGGRVRVWPVHENDWKREIVRLEPYEFGDSADDETFVRDG